MKLNLKCNDCGQRTGLVRVMIFGESTKMCMECVKKGQYAVIPNLSQGEPNYGLNAQQVERNKMGKKKRKTKVTLIEAFVVLAIVAIIGSMLLSIVGGSVILPFMGRDTVTITVTDKERVNGSDSSKYLVFTDDEVFENTDAMIIGKFDSSDIYGEIKIGKKYKVKVYGFRVKFLSMYRNIISIEEVDAKRKGTNKDDKE